MNDQDKTPFQDEDRFKKARTVDGRRVIDILLDTVGARKMVHRDLIQGKPETGKVLIHSAHGDIKVYPLTKVRIGVGNFHREVEAAVLLVQSRDLLV